MAKADRLERLDLRRIELEAEYLDTLIAALRVTAAGSWGLFDHNRDRWAQAKTAPVVTNLCELGKAVDQLRESLHLEAFGLHQEFRASRGPVQSSAVGEPKQAQAWLEKLNGCSPANGSFPPNSGRSTSPSRERQLATQLRSIDLRRPSCGRSRISAASVGRPEELMKLPIRNRTLQPLTLFIEPYCAQHEIPPEGEAIVTLADGYPHSLDFHPENLVSLWDEGGTEAKVEVVTKEQNAVIDALAFARTWLFRYGAKGEAAAKDLDAAVEQEEKAIGYVRARYDAYRAFRAGFRAEDVQPTGVALAGWTGRDTLAAAYRAGGAAAYFNDRTRLQPGLIELGEAPFDTALARNKFDEADAFVQ